MKNGDHRYSVLIFGASGRQVLPLCKGFSDIGCFVVTYCESKLDTGYLTKYANEKILFPKASELDFLDFGAMIIEDKRFDLVVPTGDDTAIYLSKNKDKLEKHSKIAVNDYETLKYAVDKAKTMKICEDNHISAPKSVSSKNLYQACIDKQLRFPVVVKPIRGVGSIGFNIIESLKDLKKYLDDYKNEHGLLLVQEYIKQNGEPQYRVDLFRDKNGEYKAACSGKVTRWFPLDGGSGIMAITTHDFDMIKECKRLLDIINWNGYANIDLVWDAEEGKAKIIEINGRPGATMKLDYVAGINVSKLMLENELGLNVESQLEYKDNARVSCFLPDLLWFFKSKNRFNTVPSWFDRKGIKDTIFSWDDPLPSFGFLISSVRSYKKAMKLRKRCN